MPIMLQVKFLKDIGGFKKGEIALLPEALIKSEFAGEVEREPELASKAKAKK